MGSHERLDILATAIAETMELKLSSGTMKHLGVGSGVVSMRRSQYSVKTGHQKMVGWLG